MNLPLPAAPAPPRSSPNTFSSIELDPQDLVTLSFDEFVNVLVAKLTDFKGQRAAFYGGLRRTNAKWANGARAVLAILGAIALLLTALAAAVRLAPNTFNVIKGDESD